MTRTLLQNLSSPATVLFLVLLPFFILLLTPETSYSEVSDENLQPVYRIETVDGSTTIGRIIREDDDVVVIEVQDLGEVTIRRENIQTITELDESDFVRGRYWYPNPQATRYLFAPNALPLGRGKGYYQNTWIFFNNVNYGFHNRFSLGVGTVPLFLFGVAQTPVWLLPKLSLPLGTDRLNVSAGAMIGGILGSGFGGVGVLYGNVTYGDQNRNITGGLGFGFIDDGLSERPTLNIAGMQRLSRRYYLITENYLFPGGDDEYYSVASLGLRYAPESFAVDFALIRPQGVGGRFIGFPWLGVSIPFDRR